MGDYLKKTEKKIFVTLKVNRNDLNKNDTNHPIWSNSQPSETANKAIHSHKIGEGVTKPTGTSI